MHNTVDVDACKPNDYSLYETEFSQVCSDAINYFDVWKPSALNSELPPMVIIAIEDAALNWTQQSFNKGSYNLSNDSIVKLYKKLLEKT